ncbi:uncharacterized protein V1518DRAFT_418720 [Limtongia smithiae]|uniref:uncharacterized protein n=1 Tax=Limtongia smithiae TaxID=1125753 RepID=UPI0034CDBA67
MLFKPWLDLPAPRHELHEDSSSDEDVHKSGDEDEMEEESEEALVPQKKKPSGIMITVKPRRKISRLVVVAPAFESVILALSAATIAPPCSSVTIRSSVTDLTLPIFHHITHDFFWLRMPILPPTECYLVAQELLRTLDPDLTVLVTPLFVDPDDPVKVIATSKCASTVFPELSYLQAPHFITGIFAAILSCAEILQMQALALMCTAEGVPDREYVEEDVAVISAKALCKVLSIEPSSWIFDYSIFRRHQIRSTGMYV